MSPVISYWNDVRVSHALWGAGRRCRVWKIRNFRPSFLNSLWHRVWIFWPFFFITMRYFSASPWRRQSLFARCCSGAIGGWCRNKIRSLQDHMADILKKKKKVNHSYFWFISIDHVDSCSASGCIQSWSASRKRHKFWCIGVLEIETRRMASVGSICIQYSEHPRLRGKFTISPALLFITFSLLVSGHFPLQTLLFRCPEGRYHISVA